MALIYRTPHKNRPVIAYRAHDFTMDNKSNWYVYTLLGSSLVTSASPHVTTLLRSENGRFIAHATAVVLLYVTSLVLLSFAAAEHWRLQNPHYSSKKPDGKDEQQQQQQSHPEASTTLRPFPGRAAYLATWATGFVAGAYAFALPLLCPTAQHPLVHAGLRIATFFAACKGWDLTLTWAPGGGKPPVPVRGRDEVLYGLVRWQDHARYAWDVLASTRYAGFDIGVDKTARRRGPASRAWTYGSLAALPLAYVFPVAELKVVAGLAVISHSLEVVHALLHPRCPNPLFFQPFAARMPSEFWSCHWHQTAQPFLFSLGYVPAKAVFGKLLGRQAGRAAGLLGAFSLSGLWHAWGAAPLTMPEYAWAQSVGLWGIFTLQGAVVIVEKALLRDAKWRTGWRQTFVTSVFWMIAIETISIWLRYAEPRASVTPPWRTIPAALEMSLWQK